MIPTVIKLNGKAADNRAVVVWLAHEYNCDIMMYYTNTGEIHSISEGESYVVSNVYTVTWPKGEKEVEELCKETWGETIGTNENGEVENTFDSCSCHKAD